MKGLPPDDFVPVTGYYGRFFFCAAVFQERMLRMQLLVKGVVFFVLLFVFWYILQVKNIWGMGVNVQSKQQALQNSLLFAALATVIYVFLNYIFL